MSITGLNIALTVGPFTVNRLPLAVIDSTRGAVAGECVIELPDAGGQAAKGLSKGQAVELFFGYRGGPGQFWKGKITKVEAAGDQTRVTALDGGLALMETKVTECFRQETAKAVVARLFAMAGISPGRLEGPEAVIPHMIFSGRPVYQCFRQINDTLERVYKLDLSAMPYWVDADGAGHWGDFDAPGAVPVLASGDNLISHNPKGEEGEARALLCPGLLHSQKISIRDDRRILTKTVRALSVRHQIGAAGNITTVAYGQEKGYA